MREFYLLIILVRLWCVSGISITRYELGDVLFYDGSNLSSKQCEKLNGTFIIAQDETFSIHCFKAMNEKDCDLKFVDGNSNVGFIPENNKNKTFDVISTCTDNYSLKVANLTIQDYPTNTNNKVWTSYGIEFVLKFLTVQPSEKNKISLIFTSWSAGVFLKIQFRCVNDEGTVDQDSDRLCVYVKFGGNLKYPLIDNFNKPTSTYATATLVSTYVALFDTSTIPIETSVNNITQISSWIDSTSTSSKSSAIDTVLSSFINTVADSNASDKTDEELLKTFKFVSTTIPAQYSPLISDNGLSKKSINILIGVLLASFFLIIILIIILVVRQKNKKRRNIENSTEVVSEKSTRRKTIMLNTPAIFDKNKKYDEFDNYENFDYTTPDKKKSVWFVNEIFKHDENEAEASHVYNSLGDSIRQKEIFEPEMHDGKIRIF